MENSLNNQYIGRGEWLAKKILLRLINCIGIQMQVNIKHIILPEQFEILDPEVQNHNFDMVLRRNGGKDIVIEINYHHKEKIARKIRRVFEPMIIEAGYEFLQINDWDCRKRGLFWLNSAKEHLAVTWEDFRDVTDALETAGINPDIHLE